MRGFSFSWKRALGLTRVRTKIARAIRVPTSRASAQRKIGRAIWNAIFRRRR